MIWSLEEVERYGRTVIVIKREEVYVGSITVETEKEAACFQQLIKDLNNIKETK